MKQAARIARLFKIDPIDVLNSDRDTWVIRVAAAKVVEADMEAEAKKNKASAPRRTPRRSTRRRR